MSGLYGSIRPAVLNPASDVEIDYYYRPTRGTESTDFADGFKSLDPAACLIPTSGNTGNVLNGLFNLRLPLSDFNMRGIYTIYIHPKEVETAIVDVNVLANYPTVKGVVFDSSKLDGITDLTGYRIEYYTDDGITKIARLITSCNFCEPMAVSVNQNFPSAKAYNLVNNSNGSLLFCTVTPSAASSYRPDSLPFIGTIGQKVHLVNTLFNPVMLEIELVEHDADTITTMLEGTQIRDLDNALITTYNGDNEIYSQSEYYTLKAKTGAPLYDIKRKKDTIDPYQNYDNIITEN